MLVQLFGAYTLAIYSKYFIVQRGIKSIFSVPAHCQNLNILNRRKTIQQLKTISDNVLTAYIFAIKGNSIDLSFQYARRWQPIQSLQKRSWRSWFTPSSCHSVCPLARTTSGFELVGFCFSQTECFSLQILSQTINTVSALDKPALNTL